MFVALYGQEITAYFMHEQELKVIYPKNVSNSRQKFMYIINFLWGHHFSGRSVYSSEADGYASSSVAVDRVTQAGQVSIDESDKERPTLRVWEGSLEFATLPKAAQPKHKACTSGFWVGYMKPIPPPPKKTPE